MEKSFIYDCNGDHIAGYYNSGILRPLTMKYVSTLSEFTARTDDIFLCAYPRSGTHWTWELVTMLLKNTLRLHQKTKADAMLEYVSSEHLENQPSPRVINTHLYYSRLPPDVLKKKCKIILLCRNPKDVAVSFFNFIKSYKPYEYQGQFGAYLKLFQAGQMPFGDWFGYTEEWDQTIQNGSPCPIFVLHYEDMKKNFISTMCNLGNFLEVQRPTEFYEGLEKLSNFESFKKTKDACFSEERISECKGSPAFIRKGIVGDWKNWFTVSQNEEFERVYRERLNDCKIKFNIFS